ncbi:hypothetical protein RJ640_020009 [Escallonia rubra]|uniref:Uncharacterized protein n=1 Tax=Escallonia rubra TaxID=112253 RepID=A0AA88RN69_9ASTE|nr:hypothetical protein RJ640_018772 [Escallonia rubra]KAK2993064.1 hypothetical protein RJ640_020009 [Escallonia rubra]
MYGASSSAVGDTEVPSFVAMCAERQASLKEKAVPGLTAAAGLTASMVLPELGEVAGPGIFPSLNSFLLSIAGGSSVLATIVGALIGVSNFNPVERA